MPYAADLHLHSRYAQAVSSQMTLETIARWARRKGMDVVGTGDCLQPAWLDELEGKLLESESGLLTLKPDGDNRVLRNLPLALHRPLHFVLSTEVCCAPVGTPELQGVHHLLYFRSIESVRKFRQRVALDGDLTEGRPTLRMSSKDLLEQMGAHADGGHLVPAHIWNPFFSSLGSDSGANSLVALFGELASRIKLVETGLTSTPAMCRRFSALDGCALFSCSDAHSPENVGRECTLLETELNYDALFAALGGSGPGRVLGTIKFPVERTRYYLNRCTRCQKSFEGSHCPQCGGRLIQGSRDRLDRLADRSATEAPENFPPYRMVLPLREVLAELCQVGKESREVERLYFHLLAALGHERFILMEASFDLIARVATGQLARQIVAQRENPPGRRPESRRSPALEQMSLTLS